MALTSREERELGGACLQAGSLRVAAEAPASLEELTRQTLMLQPSARGSGPALIRGTRTTLLAPASHTSVGARGCRALPWAAVPKAPPCQGIGSPPCFLPSSKVGPGLMHVLSPWVVFPGDLLYSLDQQKPEQDPLPSGSPWGLP